MTEGNVSTQKQRNRKILVIDDDPDVVFTTTLILEEAGHEVLSGVSASDALEMTCTHQPAILLLDVELPDGNGVDVARKIKENPVLSDVFVVMASSRKISPDEQADGLNRGLADGYLTRPLNKADFLARIDSFFRIRSYRELLQLKNAELERFTYTVSHDLKGPLLTISGFIGLLEEDLREHLNEATGTYLSMIRSGIEKMRAMMDDLLELSRTGHLADEVEPVPLRSVAEGVMLSLSGSLNEGEVDLQVNDTLPTVVGNKNLLHQLMQNLIENAVKYMGDQKAPIVEIGAEKTEKGLACFVRDNGQGISRENHGKVFELFHRLHNDDKGSGVGLALVKRIIDLHRGDIWIESAGEGQGTTFWFTLPLSDQSITEPATELLEVTSSADEVACKGGANESASEDLTEPDRSLADDEPAQKKNSGGVSEGLKATAPVLLVDDDVNFLNSLSRTLKSFPGISHVLCCQDSREAVAMMEQQPVSLVLLDMNMPYIFGETLLKEMVEKFPETPILVLSSMNQVALAVRCIKAGAFDYFIKGTEQDRLIAGVRRALTFRELQQEIVELKSRVLEPQLNHPEAFAKIITRHSTMLSLFSYIEAIAKSSEPILVTGPSGSGKEMVANAIHHISRPDRPWVAVNAAGLDDMVFSDTLFGHRRGAFTGADQARQGMVEKAAGGTLFLDEIGDLSLSSQIKLLRLIQEGEYYPLGSDTPCKSSAHLVFATNADLTERMAEGAFRKDLYYRLQTHLVRIPPLRERTGDLNLLLKYFIDEAAKDHGKAPPTPPQELAVLLATYDFPGDVRELRGMIYDAVGVHEKGKLSMQTFVEAIERNRASESSQTGVKLKDSFAFPVSLPTLNDLSEQLIGEALRRSSNNLTIAARMLGISRQALGQRLKRKGTKPQ